MFEDGYRIGDKYDIDIQFDEKHMLITLNGKALVTLNVQSTGLSVRFYDINVSTIKPAYRYKLLEHINECPNCSQGLLYLRVPADMHYDLNRDGVVAMSQFDTETFWNTVQELYCDNCGISSTSYDPDKKLAYDFDEKRRKITAVGIIKKGEY